MNILKKKLRISLLWKTWTPEDGDVFWETELGKGRPGGISNASAMA